MAAGTYVHDGHGANGSHDLGGLLREKLAWLRATPFWALSAIVHLGLILVLLGVIVRSERKVDPVTENIPVWQQPASPVLSSPPNRLAERGFRDTPRIPLPTTKDLEVKRFKTDAEHKRKERSRGSPRGRTDTRHAKDSSGLDDMIGVLGNLSDRIGDPDGPGDDALESGGPPERIDTIRAALDWLVRHQSPDGGWKAAGFLDQCRQPCRDLDPARGRDGRGDPAHDAGLTGLAMLAFTGFGHTHRDGIHEDYVQALRKAMLYLKRIQVHSPDPAANGRYGGAEGEQWVYSHAIATLAMAELLVVTCDQISLESSVTDAVKLCLHAQNDGFGWRYGIKPGDNDSSVTGWMVLALKTARNARLDIPEQDFQRAFAGALAWFHRATAANGQCGYMAPGDEGSRLAGVHPEPYPFSKEVPTLTAVAVLCRLLAGESRGAPELRAGVRRLASHLPFWRETRGRSLSTINFYYWYYASYALFQYGGEAWKSWSEAMVKTLFATQRKGFCDEDGSWDPADEWGPAGGRVYATAIAALTLEVYTRAQRLEKTVLTTAGQPRKK